MIWFNRPGQSFIPNDITIGGQESSILVLTGPNMGGKSTLLRQVLYISPWISKVNYSCEMIRPVLQSSWHSWDVMCLPHRVDWRLVIKSLHALVPTIISWPVNPPLWLNFKRHPRSFVKPRHGRWWFWMSLAVVHRHLMDMLLPMLCCIILPPTLVVWVFSLHTTILYAKNLNSTLRSKTCTCKLNRTGAYMAGCLILLFK